MIEILRHGLDEHTAIAIECAAIDLLGLMELTNRVSGQHSGREYVDELNARYGAKPVSIAKKHRVVLIRIRRKFQPGMTQDEIYDAVRRWWRIGAKRRKISSGSAPEFAFAVHDGVVRAVYRIKRWLPATTKAIAEDPTRQGRWAFVGEPEPELWNRYGMKSVRAWLPAGAQAPLRFVNCS